MHLLRPYPMVQNQLTVLLINTRPPAAFRLVTCSVFQTELALLNALQVGNMSSYCKTYIGTYYENGECLLCDTLCGDCVQSSGSCALCDGATTKSGMACDVSTSCATEYLILTRFATMDTITMSMVAL